MRCGDHLAKDESGEADAVRSEADTVSAGSKRRADVCK